MSTRTIPYRPEVDGLRAVAVLAVLIFHLDPRALPGGFVGVDVFFVISGYLITAISRRELELGVFSLRQFYGRRLRRLLPALLVVLPATLLLGLLFLSGAELARLGKHLASAVTYLSNFTLWSESGYFDADSESKPLLHLWSLAVEEHFYFVWPLALATLARRRLDLRRWTLGFALASLVAGLVTIAFYRSAAFYFSPLRFWEILCGAGLALSTGLGPSVRARRWASLAGAALVGFAMVSFGAGRVYPGSRALVPALGAVLILLGGGVSILDRVLLARAPLPWLGRISYPLYLWHWPVIVFLRLLAPETKASPGWSIAAGVLSIALADATHRLVERPAARALDPRTSAWRLLWPWCALGAAGLALWVCGGWPGRWPDFDRQMEALDHDYKSEYRNSTCPEELRRGEFLQFCREAGPGPRRAAVFGDSHAGHLLPGLIRVDPSRSWLAVGSGACPPTLDLDFEASMPNCRARSRQVLDYLVARPEIDVVVLSTYGEYASLVAYAADRKLDPRGPETIRIGRAGRSEAERYAEMEEGYDRMISALEAAGKRVVFTIDTPELPFFPRACVARPLVGRGDSACRVPRAEVDRRQERVLALARNLGRRHPRLIVHDLREGLCDFEFCHARIDGDLVYFDGHHLTHFGAARATAGLVRRLDRAE